MQERIAKSGKKYSAMKVKLSLENGEDATVFSFEPLEIGDAVKVKKNGEYWNIDAPKKGGVDLAPVMAALKFLAEQNKQILALLSDTKTDAVVDYDPDTIDDFIG